MSTSSPAKRAYITGPNINSSGPIEFVKNGVNTAVSEDTVTPANSNPLPVIDLGSNGKPVDQVALLGFGHAVATTGSPIATTGWTQLIASTPATLRACISNSTPQTLYIGYGALGSEAIVGILPTAGIMPTQWNIPAGTRVSVKAVSTAATVGEVNANFFG